MKNLLVKLLIIICLSAVFVNAVPGFSGFAYAAKGGEVAMGTAGEDGGESKDSQEKKAKKSNAYDLLNWIIDSLGTALNKVYQGLSVVAKGLIYLMTALLLVIFAINIISGKGVHYFEILRILFVVILVQKLMLNWPFFSDWVYKPIINLMLNLPAYLINKVSVEGKFAHDTGIPLKDMFLNMDEIVSRMLLLGQVMIEKHKSIISLAAGFFKGIAVYVVFFVLMVVYAYVFIVAFWSFHVLLMVLPITLPFAVYAKTRKYTMNILHNCLQFAITPAIAAISIAISLIMMGELTEEIKAAISTNEVTDGFIVKALFYGVLSIFFILKSSSFAGMVMGNPNSSDYLTFAGVVSLGAGAASLGVGAVKLGEKLGKVGGSAAAGIWGGLRGSGVSGSAGMATRTGYAIGSAAARSGKAAGGAAKRYLFGKTPG